MDGRAGNDTIRGFGDGDGLTGGSGTDLLEGGTGDDSFDGGEGGAEIWGGADDIHGGDGNDTAYYQAHTADVSVGFDDVADDGEAGEGDNVHSDVENAVGGVGKDGFDGGQGADVIAGGPAFDVADYSRRHARVRVDLGGGRDDGQSGEHDNVHSDIEGLVGGRGNDLLTGNSQGNGIAGGPGNDTIVGGGAGDGLFGDAGSDALFARDGVSRLRRRRQGKRPSIDRRRARHRPVGRSLRALRERSFSSADPLVRSVA